MEPSLTLAYILIVVGLLLMVAEMFLPTSGVLLVVSLTAVAFGVALTFIYGKDTSTGVITLISVFIALPLIGGFMFHYWPKTRVGKRFFLRGPDEDATVASMPVIIELEQLRGRFGRAISDLRPAGVAEFDGKRVDTITEGMMVEAGKWVRCIDVKAGRVIVRAVEKPDLGDLETAFFS